MEFIREKVHCPYLIAAYICMFNLVYKFFFWSICIIDYNVVVHSYLYHELARIDKNELLI